MKKEAAENAKKEEQEKLEQENQSFWNKLTDSDDLNDNLTELCDYLNKNIGATGVYISKLEPKDTHSYFFFCPEITLDLSVPLS